MDNQKELISLQKLRNSIKNSKQKADFQLTLLHDNVSQLSINIPLNELEELTSEFINKETTRIGLSDKISNANCQALSKLKEISFFSANGSYFSGFLSSEFSNKDKEKFFDIEKIFTDIYDAESGYLRNVQDHFLFNLTSNDLANILGKEKATLEEELFIKTILIKGYLVNLRELILPFYQVDDHLLIKFKKERIVILKEKEENDPNNKQIALEHHDIVSAKDSEIIARENKISELDHELLFLQNEIDLTRRNIFNLTREKQNEELEMTVNLLLKKQASLSEDLSIRDKRLKEVLSEEKDLAKVINERLTSKVVNLQSQLKPFFELKKKLSTLTFIEEDNSVKTRKILHYEKQLSDYHRINRDNEKTYKLLQIGFTKN